MNKPLKGFITYSHKDAEQKDELRERLAVMEQQNELVTWDDCQLTPGDEALQEDILEKVADSDMLLYLVSAASLASKNCNRELAEALKRKIKVIPILLEHCDWLPHQLSSFEVLPHKGKPISKWEDPSEGWQNVVDGVRKAAHKKRAQKDFPSSRPEAEILAGEAFQYGNVQLLLGQLNKTLEAYSEAIERNPLFVNAYNNRGVVYFSTGMVDCAIKDFNTAIKLDSENARVYNNCGAAYSEKGQFDKAFTNLQKSIELRPNYAPAYYNRGKVHVLKGETDLALENYNKAIELKPDYVSAYANRGIVYMNKGDFDKAIRDYDTVIELEPYYVGGYYNKGNAYMKKGDFDKAIASYNAAIEQDPDFADAYNNRGAAHESKGDFEQAIKDFKRAVQLAPNYTTAQNNLNIALRNLQNTKK